MLYPWIRVAYKAMALVTNTPVLTPRSARCPVTLQLVSEWEGREFESSSALYPLVTCGEQSLGAQVKCRAAAGCEMKRDGRAIYACPCALGEPRTYLCLRGRCAVRGGEM